jgi:hypothetical protein
MSLRFAAFALFASSTAAASPPANPPAECIQLAATVARVRADNAALADATYQPFTAPPAPPKAHVLDLGPKLAIPVGPYQCSVSYDLLPGELSMILLDKAQSTLLLVGPMTGGGPMEDVFATVGSEKSPIERVEHTRRLFGKAPDLLDLEILAWSTDASKFSCSVENLDQATRDAIVLIVKAIGSGEQVLAHRDVGFVGSHMVRRTRSRSHLVDYHWRVGATPWSYSVISSNREVVEAATALVGTFGGPAPAGVPLPGLCGEVEALVRAPSLDGARALRTRAEAVGETRLVEGLDIYLRKAAEGP